MSWIVVPDRCGILFKFLLELFYFVVLRRMTEE